ncbi:Tryptophan synthase alpha chain [Minicystis rosea]|nr:Tryptophan synthase alpha chain [Minicystis rosea]
MSRIEETFAGLRAAKKKALVAYLCMGDPSLDESIELAVAAAEAGADLLELGVPFSDPTADGPVIARAATRAIAAGSTIRGVIDAAAKIRARTKVPIVLFTYYNPVLITGEEKVVEHAKAAGIDALLLVDLPPEEGGSLRASAAREGIALVPLVAPTSDDARFDAILRAARSVADAPAGFLYYVSMTGVTGAGSADFAAARDHAGKLRARSGWPVVIGFGIDGPEAARAAAGAPGAGPDGVVVGTAIVKRIEAGKTAAERLTSVKSFVASLRAGLDAG